MQYWESSLEEDEREKLYLPRGFKIIFPSIIFIEDHGYRFVDETQSDSYGPFPTKEECMASAKQYAQELG